MNKRDIVQCVAPGMTSLRATLISTMGEPCSRYGLSAWHTALWPCPCAAWNPACESHASSSGLHQFKRAFYLTLMHYLVTFPSWRMRRSHPSLESSNGTACDDTMHTTPHLHPSDAGTLFPIRSWFYHTKWASWIPRYRPNPTQPCQSTHLCHCESSWTICISRMWSQLTYHAHGPSHSRTIVLSPHTI